tara:strand:- start:6368 stop:7567 length:1200 start_codon:yes stop_codon:yes gene_type:complete
MAFVCLKDDKIIYSFHYTLKDWIALKEDKHSSFKMPCCNTPAILKTSKLGTQFFSHKAKPTDTDCSSGGETAEHIHIKYLVSKTLFECGWAVQVEKRGVSSKGKEWIADIYATKGKIKIAIEVQWSPQAFIETKRRQQVYKDSGVRGLWLLRSGSIKDRNAITGDYLYKTKDVPVFSVYKNKKEPGSPYKVFNVNQEDTEEGLIYDRFEPIALDLEDFISRMMSSKIKFYAKYSRSTELFLKIIKQKCWACKRSMNSVAEVVYRNTNYGAPYEDRRYSGHITDFDSDTIQVINNNLAQTYGFAPLKSMYSKTMGGSFMSNSCPHCGVLMGNFFTEQALIEARYHNRVIQTDSINISRIPVIVHGKEIEADFERGEWVLFNALPKQSQITVSTDTHNAGT